MKKFLTIAIGLVLVGAAIVPFTEASRDAYHTYLYQQSLSRRGRRFAPVQRTRRNVNTVKRNTSGKPVIQNLRYNAGNKRDLYAAKETNANKFRPMSETIGFPKNRPTREKVAVKNFDPINLKMQTVVTEGFIVDLPAGWMPNIKNGEFNVKAGDDLSIEIKRYDDVCKNVSFEACSMALSEELNRLDNVGGKITSLSQISRMTQMNNRHKGSFEQTKTFTESFLGNYFGKDLFITRYFVQDGEGDLYLLEVVSNREYASEAVLVARQLFNSFRIVK